MCRQGNARAPLQRYILLRLANRKHSSSVTIIVVVILIIVVLCAFFLTGFPVVNARDFRNFVLVHKSEGSAATGCVRSVSWSSRWYLERSDFLTHESWAWTEGWVYMRWLARSLPLLRASLSILITQEFKWLQHKKEMPPYLNTSRHSLYYAKCHSGSFPENTSSQVLRGSLHPGDKMRRRKLHWMRRMMLWACV